MLSKPRAFGLTFKTGSSKEHARETKHGRGSDGRGTSRPCHLHRMVTLADRWLALEMAAKPAGELLNFVRLLKSQDRNHEVADFFYVVPEFIRQ